MRDKRFESARMVNDVVCEDLINKENVFSAAVGFKYVGGKITDEVCITCGVTSKKNRKKLKEKDIIPPEINGIPTDVVVGEMPCAMSDRTALYRPTPGGVSIGVQSIGTAGTVGCALHTETGALYGLTNAHVIPYMGGMTSAGSRCDQYNTNWVWQPSHYDGGLATDNPMGAFWDYSFLKPMDGNWADWAIFSSEFMQRHTILDVDLPLGLHYKENDIFPGDAVIKSGRTSGVTTGTVTAIYGSVLVSYIGCPGSGNVVRLLKDQIQMTSMLSGGDSGSILLHNRYDKQVAGLCFAGSTTESWANPFSAVLNQINGIPDPVSLPGLASGTGNPANAEWGFSPVDCTGLTKDNGFIRVNLKASNPGILTDNNQLELSSHGISDTNEWSIPVPINEITTEYKKFHLPLKNARTTNGELDVSAINFVRWYNYTTGGDVTLSISGPEIYRKGDYPIYF